MSYHRVTQGCTVYGFCTTTEVCHRVHTHTHRNTDLAEDALMHACFCFRFVLYSLGTICKLFLKNWRVFKTTLYSGCVPSTFSGKMIQPLFFTRYFLKLFKIVTFPSFWCWSKAAMSSVAHWTLSGLGENSSCTAWICPGWITCLPAHTETKRHTHTQKVKYANGNSRLSVAFTKIKYRSHLCFNFFLTCCHRAINNTVCANYPPWL